MKPPRPRCCGAAARTGGRTCARKVFPDASAFPPAPATVALGRPHGGGARRARATAGRRARAGSRVGLDEAPGREGGGDRATGPGLGPIGRLAQRPTLVAEGGARGACRGVEVPPVRPPGRLGCLAIVGPARPPCPLLPPPLTLAFLLCPEGSLLLGVLPPYSAWLVPSRHSRPCSNVISEWPFSTFSPHHPTFSSLHFPLSEIILLFIALTWFIGSVSPLESESHESREAVLFSHVYLASESVATSR